MKKYSLKEYLHLIESSNTKGIKSLIARKKLKKVAYESRQHDSYAKEFEKLYLENIRKCGYKTTIFIGLDSDCFATKPFQEWAEKLWRDTCYDQLRFIRNFDWAFKMPEGMIVFSNYNHKDSQLSERERALSIMLSCIKEHIGKNFSVELFGSDMLKVTLK